MLKGKLNITSRSKSTGLKYRFREEEVEIEGQRTALAAIEWCGSSEVRLDDALKHGTSKPGPEPVKTDKAIAWLRKNLTESRPSAEVIADAKAAGHSYKTLEKAKAKLKLKSYQREGDWYLPAVESGNGSSEVY